MDVLNNNDLKWVVDHTYQIATNTTLLARLHSGFLIREIVEHFQQKINDSPTPCLILYSASGNTIAKVLNALRIFDVSFHENVILFHTSKAFLIEHIHIHSFSHMLHHTHRVFILNCIR